MDNLIFEKTATHAILSATAFLVLFGFLFFLQTSSCNKAYRNSLLYLVLIDIFWNGLNVLSQLPITKISQFWMFNIASYFWIQIGFALLMSGAALTQERIHFTFWRVWNFLAVIVTIFATLFHRWYSVLTPEWYGYSARNTTFENIVTLLAIVPPIFCCIYIIAKNAFKAKDKTIKSALTFLLISVILAFFAGLFLDVVLTRFNLFVYGESSSIIGFLLILLFCRTALVLSQYSMNIQQASEVVIEQLDEGVILVSEQGKVLLANAAACALLNENKSSFKDKDILPYLSGISELTTMENFPLLKKAMDSDLTISVTIIPQSVYGSIRGYKIILRDISKEANYKNHYEQIQNRLESENFNARIQLSKIQTLVQEQDSFLSALLDNLPFMLWAKNEKGVYTQQNRRDEQEHGIRKGQTDGTISPQEIRAMHGEKQPPFETEKTAPDGRKTYYRNILQPLYKGTEKHGILCITEDITKIKELELERNELQESIRKASQMEALGNIAGGIAHDFNNILGAQIGFCELAEETLPQGENVAQTRHYLDKILLSANRAKDIVQQMLPHKENEPRKIAAISPALVIDEIISQLSASLPKTIRIKVDAQTPVPRIFGDASTLLRILLNLGTNGIYAMKETGGTLTFGYRTEPVEKDIVTRFAKIPAGRYLLMNVKDTGEGIPPNILDKIFTPFFTTKPPNEGHGLGLTVIVKLIQEANAYLTLETELGKGTNFYIYWPITGKEEEYG